MDPARLLCLWDSLGKKTGMDFHAFLQGMSSALAGGFFTTSTTWEAHSDLGKGKYEMNLKYFVMLQSNEMLRKERGQSMQEPN